MSAGFKINDVLDGRFELKEEIGEGSHGVVFRAKDRQTGEDVAVKCLHTEMALKPAVRARMEREAKAMGALAGTGAVRVISFSEARGALYLAMELLHGKTLEVMLREFEAAGQTVPTWWLFNLFDPIVDTLEVAHGMGIIHRDLKPANIFVLDDATGGGVRLLDFGLAKDLNAEALTKEGAITGSPSYIAPEGWAGRPQDIDQRIDVYTLGVVIFRVLGGRVPFQGKKMYDLILAVTRGPRPSLHALRPDLPPSIDQWVAQALASSRDQRFPTVRSLWSALGAHLMRGA